MPASDKQRDSDEKAPRWAYTPEARAAARRLAAMGGTAPNVEDIPRRRSEPSPEWAAYYAKLEAEGKM